MKNKNEYKKIVSSLVMLSMVLTGFATMFIAGPMATVVSGGAGEITGAEPLLRVYGEKDAVYPTQSYYGSNDFIYPEEYDPFDPGLIEKDSITFNPAFIDGHGGEYEIQAQGDASEKIFLRAFYEPGYTHPVDSLMDTWSDVNLYPVEMFDAIVTETTYFLVDLIGNEPTVGYPGETKIALPYKSSDPSNPGMEELGLLDVVLTCPGKKINEKIDAPDGQLTDGGIAVEKTFEFNNIDYSQDIIVEFMDHKVNIKNFENGDDQSFDSLDLEVSYIGNMNEAISLAQTHTIWEDSWGPGFYYFFSRNNQKQPWSDPAHRFFLSIENADDDYLRIKVGRWLFAGETFYVDGVRYDMPAVYVADDYGFKYITFQTPIPKGEPIWELPLSNNVDDFSHVTSQYLASLPEGTPVWVLPPFTMEHWMIDDIGLYEYNAHGCFEVPVKGMLLKDKKAALEFYYVDETTEPRFDTSLAERLDTNKAGDENWQWYNVYTLPNRYTEFVLPDQEVPCEEYFTEWYPSWYPTYIDADGNEYLITTSLVAPNSKVDLDRDDLCKEFDEHEIYDRVNEIALCGERAFYWGMPRAVYEFDAFNPVDFYVNEQTNEPSVRIYGEDITEYDEVDPVYPTQSGTGAIDYVYYDESDPFDPGVIDKDSITFNPAFIDGHGGQYEIQAQGDASEKIFLRAFYEPGYTHPVDALMDKFSDVSLYPVEKFDAIVTETTYFLVDIIDRDPTVGYAGETKIALPYASSDATNPGMEELGLLDVVAARNMQTRQLTDGSVCVEKEFEFLDDSFIGKNIRFMDHMITIVNFEESDDYSYDKVDLRVSYTGNMDDAISATETYTIWQNEWGPTFRYFFDRQNKMALNGNDPAHRWYLCIENADDDYLRIKLGRCLVAGETFYVDGVRYDMPAVYVDNENGFKYITFQTPIPKGEPIWELPLSRNVDDFSHVTSQYLASLPEATPAWVLPPFNGRHQMIDDIGMNKYGTCVKVPAGGMLLENVKSALEFYYIDETTEPRFDTSLTERLITEECQEDWLWYNVYTLPNRYTEFILPNQEIAGEYYVAEDYPSWYPTFNRADGSEYLITSSFIAPNSNLDTDRSDECKEYDEHEIFSWFGSNGYSSITQFAILIDASGSISTSDFAIMLNGIATAVEDANVMPRDGSVELTVVKFSDSANLEVNSPIIVDGSNYQTIANGIRNIAYVGGMTSMSSAFNVATTAMHGSSNFNPDYRQIVNIVTDGEPNSYASTITARNNMISTLGMDTDPNDEIDAEAIGDYANPTWLRDNIVWPQPGSIVVAPPFTPGWVREIETFEDFVPAIAEKFESIFAGTLMPRFTFEFDANDGTGFFINENGAPVTQPPTADANGPYSGDIGETIYFDGSGSYDNDESGASIVQYDWKYYSGDVWHNDQGAYPSHVYSAKGTYTVTLRVTDDEGETDTDTATVTIAGPITTDSWIIMDDVCIPTGDTAYAYLRATGITEDVGSCEVTLSWDPTVVSIINIDNSDFDVIYNYIDNTAGTANIVASNTHVALTGDFNIARIQFEAIGTSTDQCPVTIDDSTLLSDDPVPSNIAHSAMNGLAIIDCGNGSPDDGDMNGDGNVNSADVRYLALYLAGNPAYSPLKSDGDVNSDGNVNSADVRYLALYLAGNPLYSPLYP